MIENSIESFLSRYTVPSRLYASNGTTLKKINHGFVTYQASNANGDRIQTFFMCNGTETTLALTTRPRLGNGIFDLYVNGVLDSSGYDDYAAVTITKHIEITLTESIKKGLNLIEFRMNGKNGASSGYLCNVVGVALK